MSRGKKPRNTLPMSNEAKVAQSRRNEAATSNPPQRTLPAIATETLSGSRAPRTASTSRGESFRLATHLRELPRGRRQGELSRAAAHIGHVVQQNMAPAAQALDALHKRLAHDAESLDLIAKLTSGLTALEAAVEELAQFDSHESMAPKRFDVRQLTDDVVNSLQLPQRAPRVQVVLDVPAHLGVLADYGMLRRALLNLVINALDAMPQGGELTVTACQGRDGVEIEVSDTGPGLSDENKRHLCQPFYSTKTNGMGLGLAIARRISEMHGGGFMAGNCPEGGAAFTMRIPTVTLRVAA